MHLVGKLSSSLIGFAISIVVVRYLDRAEYGLVTLVYSLAGILSILSLLGLKSGIPRYLAHGRGLGQEPSLEGVVTPLLFGVLLLSSVLAAATSFNSDVVAGWFDKPAFSPVLRVMVWLLPALVCIQFLVSLFRGRENAKAKVVFEDILYQGARLLLLLGAVFAGLGLAGVVWAYLVSAFIAAIGFLLFAARNTPLFRRARFNWRGAGSLLRFSLPLTGVELMLRLFTVLPVVCLGVWSTAEQIALFNAPLRVGAFINLAMVGLLFLFLPVATRLFAQGLRREADELYQSTTKWISFLSLPIGLVLVLDGEFFLQTLYGPEYAEGWPVLAVLAVGLLLHNFFGMNGNAMVAMGYRSAPLGSSLIAVCASLALSAWLIPERGALGAALAVASGQTLSNLYLSGMLYWRAGIHPFHWPVVSPMACAGVAAGAAHWGLGLWAPFEHSVVLHGLFWVAMPGLVLAAALGLRALNDQDLEVLDAFERRIRGTKQLSAWLRAHGWVRPAAGAGR